MSSTSRGNEELLLNTSAQFKKDLSRIQVLDEKINKRYSSAESRHLRVRIDPACSVVSGSDSKPGLAGHDNFGSALQLKI